MGEQDKQEITNDNEQKRYTDPVTGRFIEGNPGGGRPKGAVSVTEAIRRKLQEYSDPEKKRTYLDELIEKILDEALVQGNSKLIDNIWSYMDGKPMNNISLTSGAGKEDRESLRDTLNRVLNGDIDTSDKKQDIEGSSQ